MTVSHAYRKWSMSEVFNLYVGLYGEPFVYPNAVIDVLHLQQIIDVLRVRVFAPVRKELVKVYLIEYYLYDVPKCFPYFGMA